MRLRNTGDRRGKQVVQVYADRDRSPRSGTRPAGWPASPSSHADAGEVVDVPVEIHPRALRHWDVERSAWAVEPGPLTLSTGPSAGDLRASVTVVAGRGRAEPA